MARIDVQTLVLAFEKRIEALEKIHLIKYQQV